MTAHTFYSGQHSSTHELCSCAYWVSILCYFWGRSAVSVPAERARSLPTVPPLFTHIHKGSIRTLTCVEDSSMALTLNKFLTKTNRPGLNTSKVVTLSAIPDTCDVMGHPVTRLQFTWPLGIKGAPRSEKVEDRQLREIRSLRRYRYSF